MKSALKSMSNEELRKKAWRYEDPNPFREELNRRDFKRRRAVLRNFDRHDAKGL